MDSNMSSSNDSHPELQTSGLASGSECLFIGTNSSIFITCSIIYVLILLPLCILVLCLCLQQWKSLSSSSSSAATMSHSNCFTCHLVLMELVGYIPGFIIQVHAVIRKDSNLLKVGNYLVAFSWYGEIFFHVLTCLERYLAVVHPVTYLSLKSERAVRIRNVTISSVWLISLAETCLIIIPQLLFLDLCLLIISLITVSFCSLSVLYILIRPGPGEPGGNRVHQTKQRAFYCIVAILGVLELRFMGDLSWAIGSVLKLDVCLIIACEAWFNLPSSLVLLVLFLHREGKLMCPLKNIT